MKRLLISLFILLTACSGKPYESIEGRSTSEMLENKKPIWSSDKRLKKESQQQTVIYSPYPQGNYPSPVTQELPEGALSFEEWKRAKEANTQEYQDFVEYQQYLQVIGSQSETP